jgi:nitrate/nitrite transporter NarK
LWSFAFAVGVQRPESMPNPLGGDERALAASATRAVPSIHWSHLLLNLHMLLLCAQQFMRAAAFALFFTWFPRYLQETKGVTETESGTLAMWPLVVGMFGGLLGGTVSDWLLRKTGNSRLSRQGLATVATALCAAVSLAAAFVESATGAVILVSVAGFCGYVGGVSAYATAIMMGGKRVATVFATMNMAGNIGAGIFPFVLGRLVGQTGDWNVTLVLFAGLFAGATVCWAILNPKGPLFEGKE